MLRKLSSIMVEQQFCKMRKWRLIINAEPKLIFLSTKKKITETNFMLSLLENCFIFYFQEFRCTLVTTS